MRRRHCAYSPVCSCLHRGTVAKIPTRSWARYVQTGQQGAANTQRAYAGDWKRFTTWCREHGREALPADVLTVAAFVTALAEAGKRWPPSSAIARR